MFKKIIVILLLIVIAINVNAISLDDDGSVCLSTDCHPFSGSSLHQGIDVGGMIFAAAVSIVTVIVSILLLDYPEHWGIVDIISIII